MGKSGNNIAEHVRSAKMWLEKAEQSFDRQSEIQGELNLMLAEAEMKNLRKRHGLKVRAKLRVAAAMGIAVMAAGLWYAATRESPSTALPARDAIPVVRQQSPEKLPAAPARTAAQPEPYTRRQAQAEPAAASRPTASQEQRDDAAAPASAPEAAAPIQRSAPAPKEVLTDAQIQQAVRDARHSLRGTDVKNK
ncbi:hypothetical protein E0L13_02570 [Megasphaera sp. SW808]|uniref:hypothetical protein n=1 Tax=Megasphaera sp. SW808 TaxID=2530045 RepID=UPI00143B32CD|nr:hypothetical protein [Megasphaera sp. SW808]NJE33908.1 hypothetical protein [Megasphaera sp. SW808]